VQVDTTWAGCGGYTLTAATDLPGPHWMSAEVGCTIPLELSSGQEGGCGRGGGAGISGGGEGWFAVPSINTTSQEELDAFLLQVVGGSW